jgi:hypothetical protein
LRRRQAIRCVHLSDAQQSVVAVPWRHYLPVCINS